MRILLLSRNAALYSTSRLLLAARARNHTADVIDPLQLTIAAAGPHQGLRFRGKALPRYDAVIPRIGVSITDYGEAVLRQFPKRVALLNDASAIELARDKLRSLQRVGKKRVRVPATVCVRSLTGLDDAVALVGGYPLVMKLQRGTQGVGTMLMPSAKVAFGMLETMLSMGHEVLLQQYVSESAGRDMRALVVGNKVVAAMRRVATDGDFRANLHRGGLGEVVKLDRSTRAMAIRAAKACGLEVAGVDMLEQNDGPSVIELNASPGLEGIEHVSRTDVASAIIKHAEKMASDQTSTKNEKITKNKSSTKKPTKQRATGRSKR